MPELLEVEQYRTAAATAVGRRIRRVRHVDGLALRQGGDAAALAAVVEGRRLIEARRHGKVLLLDLDDGTTVGLRFGMTGRLIVDGVSPIEQLLYSAHGDDPAWDRLVLDLDGGGQLRVNDPRRLGAVLVDPDLDALGPDAASITAVELGAALRGRSAPIKAALLDQHVVAGIGNLLADDALWRAKCSPLRSAGGLSADEVAALRRAIRTTLRTLGRRGGSHTGDLQAERHAGGRCPRCGAELRRDQVGGRTTWWCPAEQR